MEENKKFSITEIVLGTMIAGLDDVADIVAIIAFGIPVIGLVVTGGVESLHFLVGWIMIFWFRLKLGKFGGTTFLQITDAVLELFGIPGRTIAFLIGVFVTNNPKVAKVATIVAVGVATGGAGAAAAAAGGGAAAGVGGATAGAVAGGEAAGATAAAEGAGAVGGAAAEGAGATGSVGKSAATAADSAEEAGSQISEEAFGVEKNPLEQLQDTMQNLPEPEEKEEKEEDSSRRPPVEDIRKRESL